MKGLMLNPAFNTFPEIKVMFKWTSGGLAGFSCLTQWANVSSRSNIMVFLMPGLVKGSSMCLYATSAWSILSKFCKKLIDYNICIVNSLNTGPFNS